MSNKRYRLIQLIHVAQTDLGLNKTKYKWEIEQATSTFDADLNVIKAGKDSCSKMTIKELEAVLKHFKAMGFKVKKPKSAGKVKPADDPQSRLIRSLWLQLHDAGAVRDPSETALNKFVENQVKVSALQFLSTKNASYIIERLKQWLARVEKAKEQAHG